VDGAGLRVRATVTASWYSHIIKEAIMTRFTTIRIPQTSPEDRATVAAASRQFGTQHPERWAIRGKVVATGEDGDGNRWADVRLEWVGER
jgi:hypothetical protein